MYNYWNNKNILKLKQDGDYQKVKFLCHFSQQISFVVNHNKISYKSKDTWHIDFEKCIGNFLNLLKLKIT